jgi:hypothetical protein
MSHLPTDRLAALAGEAPSSEEAAHLAVCTGCARELQAYEALLAMSSAEGEAATFGATRLAMPLTRWDSLSAELRKEGLIGSSSSSVVAKRSMGMPRWATRAAAAVLLVSGGVIAGRLSASTSVRVAATDRPAVSTPKPNDKPTAQPPERSATDQSLYASNIDALIPATFQSVEDARVWQQKLEIAYQNAAMFIATHDTSDFSSDVPGGDRAVRTRLAALDRAQRVMRDALREAPADPVINGYYLTTLGQREAALRQINVAAPADQRVIGF